MQVVAAGLFYIDMFAGGTGEDRRRRMPMIRGGDRNRVNVPILKHLAQVGNAFGLARLFFEDSLDSLLGRAAVHVANVSNLRVRRSQVTGDVRHPAAIAADDGDGHFLAGAFGGAKPWGAGERDGTSGKNGTLFQELATIDWVGHALMKVVCACAGKKTQSPCA